ncbi:MAG: hypothetical protein U0T69_11490 [Chitinophagales bacterium]
MINIDALNRRFDFLANLSQQGYVSPEKRDELAKYASYGLFKQRLGFPEQMEFQTAIPKISYARTKKIHIDLEPFRKIIPLQVSNDKILLTALPEDVFITNIRYKTIVEEKNLHLQRKLKNCGCKPATADQQYPNYITYLGDIDPVQEDKWSNRVNSSIIKQAIYCTYHDSILFHFPLGNNPTVEIHYLAKPVTPKWNYTIVNDEPVYDPSGSVDLEWNELLTDEVAARMLKEYSKYNSDQGGAQHAQGKINNGE